MQTESMPDSFTVPVLAQTDMAIALTPADVLPKDAKPEPFLPQ